MQKISFSTFYLLVKDRIVHDVPCVRFKKSCFKSIVYLFIYLFTIWLVYMKIAYKFLFGI